MKKDDIMAFVETFQCQKRLDDECRKSEEMAERKIEHYIRDV